MGEVWYTVEMFDITLNAVDIDVTEVELGNEHAVQASFVIGIMLPISSGPGQPPLIAPGGVVRLPLSKSAAIDFFKGGLEVAEGLPDEPKESDLVVASSLEGVDKFANADATLRGNGR